MCTVSRVIRTLKPGVSGEYLVLDDLVAAGDSAEEGGCVKSLDEARHPWGGLGAFEGAIGGGDAADQVRWQRLWGARR